MISFRKYEREEEKQDGDNRLKKRQKLDLSAFKLMPRTLVQNISQYLTWDDLCFTEDCYAELPVLILPFLVNKNNGYAYSDCLRLSKNLDQHGMKKLILLLAKMVNMGLERKYDTFTSYFEKVCNFIQRENM